MYYAVGDNVLMYGTKVYYENETFKLLTGLITETGINDELNAFPSEFILMPDGWIIQIDNGGVSSLDLYYSRLTFEYVLTLVNPILRAINSTTFDRMYIITGDNTTTNYLTTVIKATGVKRLDEFTDINNTRFAFNPTAEFDIFGTDYERGSKDYVFYRITTADIAVINTDNPYTKIKAHIMQSKKTISANTISKFIECEELIATEIKCPTINNTSQTMTLTADIINHSSDADNTFFDGVALSDLGGAFEIISPTNIISKETTVYPSLMTNSMLRQPGTGITYTGAFTHNNLDISGCTGTGVINIPEDSNNNIIKNCEIGELVPGANNMFDLLKFQIF
jgi:hypothetical protein